MALDQVPDDASELDDFALFDALRRDDIAGFLTYLAEMIEERDGRSR